MNRENLTRLCRAGLIPALGRPWGGWQTFARGASLEDPSDLFNVSLEGNTRRAIDFHEGDEIDGKALMALIRAAVALNRSGRATARPVRSQKRPRFGCVSV
jgi:hypothetical protein